jgi:hypothetical protein
LVEKLRTLIRDEPSSAADEFFVSLATEGGTMLVFSGRICYQPIASVLWTIWEQLGLGPIRGYTTASDVLKVLNELADTLGIER